MPNAEDYEKARGRAKAKYGFYVHAVVYAAVIGLLLFINLATSSGNLWVIWPLLGWGVFLALHGAKVFLGADNSAIIDDLTEHELKRSHTNSPENGK